MSSPTPTDSSPSHRPSAGRSTRGLTRGLAALAAAAVAACSSGSERGGEDLPVILISDPVQVVPSAALSADVATNRANNNLDIADHDGRLFLAFRTAPTHFASADTVMYVVSTGDERSWQTEARFAMESDLREPRFFSWQGRLFLYFAQLGTSPVSFEPGRMWRSERLAMGQWTEPEVTFQPDFIPWRIKVFDGVPIMVGYEGGENIYNLSGEPIKIYLLTTQDGLDWRPLDPDRPVVLEGGGSETDIEIDDRGDLFAVVRNEAGDETGFGSKICKASRADLTRWECNTDPRKYDSPLLFQHRSEIYLVGRRNLTESGAYDLGRDDLGHIQKLLTYQLDYWLSPKRCSVWHLDRKRLAVDFLMDLPSRGDTCFPSMLPRGKGRFLLYNYSSHLDGPDVAWLRGQLGDTFIYSMLLDLDDSPTD